MGRSRAACGRPPGFHSQHPPEGPDGGEGPRRVSANPDRFPRVQGEAEAPPHAGRGPLPPLASRGPPTRSLPPVSVRPSLSALLPLLAPALELWARVSSPSLHGGAGCWFTLLVASGATCPAPGLSEEGQSFLDTAPQASGPVAPGHSCGWPTCRLSVRPSACPHRSRACPCVATSPRLYPTQDVLPVRGCVGQLHAQLPAAEPGHPASGEDLRDPLRLHRGKAPTPRVCRQSRPAPSPRCWPAGPGPSAVPPLGGLPSPR